MNPLAPVASEGQQYFASRTCVDHHQPSGAAAPVALPAPVHTSTLPASSTARRCASLRLPWGRVRLGFRRSPGWSAPTLYRTWSQKESAMCAGEFKPLVYIRTVRHRDACFAPPETADYGGYCDCQSPSLQRGGGAIYLPQGALETREGCGLTVFVRRAGAAVEGEPSGAWPEGPGLRQAPWAQVWPSVGDAGRLWRVPFGANALSHSLQSSQVLLSGQYNRYPGVR